MPGPRAANYWSIKLQLITVEQPVFKFMGKIII